MLGIVVAEQLDDDALQARLAGLDVGDREALRGDLAQGPEERLPRAGGQDQRLPSVVQLGAGGEEALRHLADRLL